MTAYSRIHFSPSRASCVLRVFAVFKLVALTAAGLCIAPLDARGQDGAASAAFRFEEKDDKSLGLWEGDKPVLVYNHGDIGLPSRSNLHPHSNYVHPLYGLDGEVLTDDFPRDHYHHRGLYWAWPHIKVGEKPCDTWGYRGIKYKFKQWLARDASAEGAKLGIETAWVVEDKEVVNEKAQFLIHPATNDGRNIDIELTWTPVDEPLTLWGAEGKSYGGLVLRFGPRSETHITTEKGRIEGDLVITKLPWADLAGEFSESDVSGLRGAAVFVDPRHPDFPPEWMTRQYGVLAVGWPGVSPQTFPPGEPITVRYRVWIHRGAPTAAEIQRQYDAYRGAIVGEGRR